MFRIFFPKRKGKNNPEHFLKNYKFSQESFFQDLSETDFSYLLIYYNLSMFLIYLFIDSFIYLFINLFSFLLWEH